MLGLWLRLAVVVAALAFAPAARAETALFDLGEPAPAAADGDTARVVLGTRIDVYRAFVADGIDFYAPEGSRLGGSWVYLWDGARLVASGRAAAGDASGWVRVPFSDGLHVLEPGHEYVAAYLAEHGGYASTTGYHQQAFGPAGVGLLAPVDGGVYRYLDGPEASVGIPRDTWRHSSYWVTPYDARDWRFEPATTGPWPLYDDRALVANPASDDTADVEVGVRFGVQAPPGGWTYTATAVRFYRAPGAGMVENRVQLYDEDGDVVGHGAFVGEGPRDGWVDVALDKPVALAPGETYTASYVAQSGRYAENRQGFAAPRHAGPATFPRDAGVYRYGGGFPDQSWEASDYYVAPVIPLLPAN